MVEEEEKVEGEVTNEETEVEESGGTDVVFGFSVILGIIGIIILLLPMFM